MALRPTKTPPPAPSLSDSLKRPIGDHLRSWLNEHIGANAQDIAQLALDHVIATPQYGASVKIDLAQGAIQKVVVTNGTAFTIANPVNPTALARFLLMIVNNSGGALGAVTFGSNIEQAGFSAPSNGLRASALFLLDGTKFVQVSTWCVA